MLSVVTGVTGNIGSALRKFPFYRIPWTLRQLHKYCCNQIQQVVLWNWNMFWRDKCWYMHAWIVGVFAHPCRK